MHPLPRIQNVDCEFDRILATSHITVAVETLNVARIGRTK